MNTQEKVRRYYLAATSDYLRYYETEWHHHMHYGFQRNLPEGGNPTENLVRYLADVCVLKAGDRVLDAGCGVGGTAIWLTKEKGCACVGLNLMEFQLRLARGFASKKKARVSFAAGDFMHPPFAADSFDAVVAIESFDHAPDKPAWVRCMAGLLRPGGKLLIVDGFKAEAPFLREQRSAYEKFLAGWAVPHLCTVADLKSWGIDADLETLHDEDITPDVLPHASAIRRFAFFFVPLRFVLLRLGLSPREKLGNALATWHQYRTLKQGLWSYRVMVFKKPLAP